MKGMIDVFRNGEILWVSATQHPIKVREMTNFGHLHLQVNELSRGCPVIVLSSDDPAKVKRVSYAGQTRNHSASEFLRKWRATTDENPIWERRLRNNIVNELSTFQWYEMAAFALRLSSISMNRTWWRRNNRTPYMPCYITRLTCSK